MSEEYLTVTSDIPFGSVFAYRVGDRIARSAVEQNNWQDYVAADEAKGKTSSAAKKES